MRFMFMICLYALYFTLIVRGEKSNTKKGIRWVCNKRGRSVLISLRVTRLRAFSHAWCQLQVVHRVLGPILETPYNLPRPKSILFAHYSPTETQCLLILNIVKFALKITPIDKNAFEKIPVWLSKLSGASRNRLLIGSCFRCVSVW